MTAIEDNDVRTLLKAAIATAGSLRDWAERHNISHSYVIDVLAGKQAPGPKVQRALGVTSRRVYVRESEEEGA